jgi:hypothetical protein
MRSEIERVLVDLHRCGMPKPALVIPALAMALSWTWLALGQPRAAVGDFLGVTAALLGFFGVAVLYASYRPHPVFAALIGAIAVLAINFFAGGILALMAVTASAPLIDPQLAWVDEIFGIDHRAMIALLAPHSTLVLALQLVYGLSVHIMFAIGIFLAVTRQFARLRVYLTCHALTITVIALASIVLPAVGSYVHYGLHDVAPGQMPPGAGVYHLPVFQQLRDGGDVVISPLKLEGVITFPSFHICMALLIGFGLAGSRGVRWVGYGLMAATTIATVPIGGHYIVDLVAGAAVFVVSLRLSQAWTEHDGAARDRYREVGSLQPAV